MSGFFISFEGGEGSGKSTQAKMLAQSLEASGAEVLMTREPGGSSGAEIVRTALLTGAVETLGPDVEALLFSMARADHVEQVINPALDAGSIVICDRFLDSTRAYQGSNSTVSAELVAGLEMLAVGDTMPDLTFVLDLPAERGLRRARKRNGEEGVDRFEKDALTVQEQRRAVFLEIARREPDRVVVIDADRPVEDINNEIRLMVSAARIAGEGGR